MMSLILLFHVDATTLTIWQLKQIEVEYSWPIC